MFWRGKLIRESEWMRVYESDGGTVHESKFLTGGLQVSADSIITRWPQFSLEQKLEFALAFQSKPQVTTEDERILNFLMEVGDFPIWLTIAPLLPRHSDRDRVLAFLAERIREEGHSKANYYQSIQQLQDKRGLPVLRAAYDRYEEKLRKHGKLDRDDDYLDYLSCCKALWKTEGSPEYKEAIERYVQSQDEKVRVWAEQILRDK